MILGAYVHIFLAVSTAIHLIRVRRTPPQRMKKIGVANDDMIQKVHINECQCFFEIFYGNTIDLALGCPKGDCGP